MTEFGNTVSHVGTSKKSFSHYDISQTTLICLSFGSSLSTLSVCVCDSVCAPPTLASPGLVGVWLVERNGMGFTAVVHKRGVNEAVCQLFFSLLVSSARDVVIMAHHAPANEEQPSAVLVRPQIE